MIDEDDYAVIEIAVDNTPKCAEWVELTVDWGDGTSNIYYASWAYPSGPYQFTHIYGGYDDDPSSGTPIDYYQITITGVDDAGLVDTLILPIEVWNVPPEHLSIYPFIVVNEYTDFSLVAGWVDPGWRDTFTMTVDWGDGSSSILTGLEDEPIMHADVWGSSPHRYDDDDPSGTPWDIYPVTVTVTDDDTGTATRESIIKVVNVAPTAQLTSNGPVPPGSPVTVTFINIQDNPHDTLSFSFDWNNDGDFADEDEGPGSSPSRSHIYEDPGGYTVRGRIEDDDTGYNEYITSVGVGWDYMTDPDGRYGVDVDIDSDNNNGFAAPERSVEEDQIEDDAKLGGKRLTANNDDQDADGVPDYADGFDLLAEVTTDHINPYELFTPIVFEIGLASEYDLNTALVRLSYNASDPAAVTRDAQNNYHLPEGSLRLWRKPGNQARDKVADFLAPGVYTAAELVGTFYVEALAPCGIEWEQERIALALDPSALGGFSAADAVRVSLTEPDLHILLPGSRIEVGTGLEVPAGQATVALNTGTLQVYHPLDFRLSHDSTFDGFIDLEGNPLQGMVSPDGRHFNAPDGVSTGIRDTYTSLVYSSDSVNVRPIIQVSPEFNPALGEPIDLQLQLSWNNGTPQPWRWFSTDDRANDQGYLLADQVVAPVTQSGRYPWAVTVQATFENGTTQTQVLAGWANVVVRDQSQFGAGWSLAGLNDLLVYTDGVMMIYGNGEPARWFQEACDGEYESPDDDFGTLERDNQDPNKFIYTSKHGVRWNYEQAAGSNRALLKTIIDPHDLAITFTYSATNELNTIALPDGSVTTFNTLGIQAAGGRDWLLTRIGGNLFGITNPDGSYRNFQYDSEHHLTHDQWDPIDVTYHYDPVTDVLVYVDRGLDTTWTIRPTNVVPLRVDSASGADDGLTLAVNPRSFTGDYRLDPKGWITQWDAPDGTTQSWIRGESEQVELYFNQATKRTAYAYNDDGDLIEIAHPSAGGRERFEYDPEFHRRTRYEDATNKVTQYGYNAEADRVTIIDARNKTTTQVWTADGLLESVTDRRNKTTNYAYETGTRRLESITDAVEATTTFLYDSAGYLETIENAKNQLTTTVYDLSGRLLEETGVDGSVTAYEYNAVGQLVRRTDARGTVTEYEYDQQGRLVSLREAVGTPDERITNTFYDSAGNVLSVDDARGVTTSYAYDVMNRRTRTIEAYGHGLLRRVTKTAYDALGNVASITNPLGQVTQYQYDSMNRPTVVTEVLGVLGFPRVTTTTYDKAGHVASVIDPMGRTTVYNRDELYRVVQVTEALGTPVARTTQIVYDNEGNVVSEIDARGTYTDYVYDDVGRRTQVIEAANFAAPLRHVTTMTYDVLGQLETVTDPRGVVTRYDYDEPNRTTWITEGHYVPAGIQLDHAAAVTTMVYDEVGNLVNVIDALGRTVTNVYDRLNRQTAILEPLGRSVSFAYDENDNLITETDPRGNVTSHVYDALNRLVQTTEALGSPVQRTTRTTYDPNDNVFWARDPRGIETGFTYDIHNRVIATTEARYTADQRATTFVYDLNDNITSITEPFAFLNRETRFFYDQLNRRTTVWEGVGYGFGGSPARILSTAYDPNDNILSTTDGRGVITSYVYDALNRRTAVYENWALGYPNPTYDRATFTEYDVNDNVVATTNGRGVVTSYVYDALNRRKQVIEAAQLPAGMTPLPHASPVTTMTYDAVGNLLTVTDPLNHTTTHSYDALNQLVAVTNALNQTTSLAYDANGNLLAETNPRGVVTHYDYDALDRRTTVIAGYFVPAGVPLDHGPAVTTTVFDPNDNVLAVIDPLNHTTSFSYDSLNRRRTATDALGHTTTMAYDKIGNLLSTTDPAGHITSYAYDVLNRRVQVIDGFEFPPPSFGNPNTQRRITEMQYDGNDNLIEVKDPVGSLTTYVYDTLNRRTVTIDPLSARTTLAYDAQNNVLSVTDADNPNNPTTYEFDGLDRQVKTTDALGKSTTFLYDAAGNLLSTTDRRQRRRDFSYDPLNRKQTETWYAGVEPIENIAYGYDAACNLTLQSNNFSSYVTTYDALNRPKVVVQQPANFTLTYTYDAAGRRTQVQDSAGGLVVSTYNNANLLQSRLLKENGVDVFRVDLTYTSRNLLERTDCFEFVNGAFTPVAEGDRTYDAFGDLRSLVWQRPDGGQAYESFDYLYDKAGHLVQETRSSPGAHPIFSYTTTFVYDTAGQVTAAWGSDGVNSSYGFSLNGNRTTQNGQAVSTGLGNRVQSDGQYQYTYDEEGNLTQKVRLENGQPTASMWLYLYDHANRLVLAKQWDTNGNWVKDVFYQYDARGLKIEQKVVEVGSTKIERYAYNGQDVVADLDANNSVKMRYLRGDVVDQLFARHATPPPSGVPAKLWYLQDRLGSVVDLVSADLAVQKQLRYQPFGSEVLGQSSTVPERYRFTGREYDEHVFLQYNRARWYDGHSGRWLSEDPLGYAAGDANLYRYVHNSPTNYTDPSGEIIPILLMVGFGLAGTGLSHAAASQYNQAREMLGKPRTPENIEALQKHLNRAQWLHAGANVSLALTTAAAGGALLGGGLGFVAGWGRVGAVTAATIGAGVGVSGLAYAGYEGYTIARDWSELNGPERFERVGSLGGSLLVGGWAAGRGFRAGFRVGQARYKQWLENRFFDQLAKRNNLTRSEAKAEYLRLKALQVERATEIVTPAPSVAHRLGQLRRTVHFLKQEGITDRALRRSIIEAGLEGPIGADTPRTLNRFRQLFPETLARGRGFKGPLGDIKTRVATLNEAVAMERAGLRPRFEFPVSSSLGRTSVDLVGVAPRSGQVTRAIQFVRALLRADGSFVFHGREARNAAIIEKALGPGFPEFVVTVP